MRKRLGAYALKVALTWVSGTIATAVHVMSLAAGRDPLDPGVCRGARVQRDHGALHPDAEEECLYLHDFRNLEEARRLIREFIEAHNREWLLERHGYRTPAEVRRQLALQAA